ncbi:MAG: hypothetical protein JWL63_3281 [Rhodocyclales bacterium]|nr:hypothetical protein [Rhodocyclales bacterium]
MSDHAQHIGVQRLRQNTAVKWLTRLTCVWLLTSCAAFEKKESPDAVAQVGIVNHTGKFIYSASVDGSGGGTMSAWGAGVAGVCCTSIPRVWHPGMKVLVRWDMPDGHTHIVKEKIVEVEKYDEPGSIYMHFFPNDEVRVVVSWVGPRNPKHPIPPPVKPATQDTSK